MKYWLVLFCFTAPLPAFSNGLQDHVVTLQVTKNVYDFLTPWSDLPHQTLRAQGVYLGDGLVLTSAQAVKDSMLIELEKGGDSKRYSAEVVLRDYQCMLALVRAKDRKFGDGLRKVTIGKEAALHTKGHIVYWNYEGNLLRFGGEISKASVFYYRGPILCSRVSTEAPRVPLGSPFFFDGKLQGLVYSLDTQAKEATVSTPRVIERFMKDYSNGDFQGMPGDGLVVTPLANDEPLQKYLGLKQGQEGVLVVDVERGSPCWNVLQKGDVLMAVGGVLVNEKGYFSDPLYGKIGYEVLFWQGRQAGEKLKVSVLREGKKKSLTVTVKPIPWKDYLIYWSHDKKPRYFVMGGMVFQEVTYNYLETYGSSWRKNAGARLVHLESSMGRNPPEDRPHLVVLSRILRDKINEGYGDLTGSIVETVNGQSVKDLDHFVAIIEASNDKFVHLGFSGNLEVVMETQELKKRDPEILKVHKISKDRRL